MKVRIPDVTDDDRGERIFLFTCDGHNRSVLLLRSLAGGLLCHIDIGLSPKIEQGRGGCRLIEGKRHISHPSLFIDPGIRSRCVCCTLITGGDVPALRDILVDDHANEVVDRFPLVQDTSVGPQQLIICGADFCGLHIVLGNRIPGNHDVLYLNDLDIAECRVRLTCLRVFSLGALLASRRWCDFCTACWRYIRWCKDAVYSGCNDEDHQQKENDSDNHHMHPCQRHSF